MWNILIVPIYLFQKCFFEAFPNQNYVFVFAFVLFPLMLSTQTGKECTMCADLAKIQFGQIPLAIRTNTYCNLDIYILCLGQIHRINVEHTIWQRVHHLCRFGQIHFAIRINTFCNFDKYILQLGQIHIALLINTFSDWDQCTQSMLSIQTEKDKMQISIIN